MKRRQGSGVIAGATYSGKKIYVKTVNTDCLRQTELICRTGKAGWGMCSRERAKRGLST